MKDVIIRQDLTLMAKVVTIIAITTATYIGKKFVNKLPYTNYISNLVMIAIAIKLII